jgi:hypothetical protein
MEVRYYEEERFLCVELFRDSDGLVFQSIANELSETFNVEWKIKLDGLDQRYWDFEYKGIILTLHLEHYLGINIHIAKATTNTEIAAQVLKEIGDHFKDWRAKS